MISKKIVYLIYPYHNVYFLLLNIYNNLEIVENGFKILN